MTQPMQPFVRNQMLAQQKPPTSEQGAVKWVRENLFSGWVNSILTLIGLYLVYQFFAATIPWLMHGVWNANSLMECRQIIADRYADGVLEKVSGACWAVIRERWHQYLFGFYPSDEYWRPTMALALMFVALAPALFLDNARAGSLLLAGVAIATVLALIGLEGVTIHVALTVLVFGVAITVMSKRPALLLWFTLLYPLIGFFLLWGGSVWGPVGVLIGAGIMVLAFRMLSNYTGVAVAAGVSFLIACVWWFFLQTYVTTALQSALPFRLSGVDSDRFGGFVLAFTIGVTAISGSLPIGIILALGRQSNMPLVKGLCIGFIEFIRGVPLITMLFTASLLLQYFLPPTLIFDLILRVIILVTIFASAYIAEVIRGGLAALPKGQYEAADALGLDYWQAQRLIIMPQALKISIPGIVGSFIGLFKDTTLVALVGLADPLVGITKVVRADINWKAIYWEPYIFVGAIFFIFCFSMSRYSMYLERKLKTDHR